MNHNLKLLKGDIRIWHQQLVRYAREYGIRMTARHFECSRNTVRRWLRRAQPGEPIVFNMPPIRRHHPNPPVPQEEVDRIIKLHKTSGYGKRRLKKYGKLQYSEPTIQTILTKHGLKTNWKHATYFQYFKSLPEWDQLFIATVAGMAHLVPFDCTHSFDTLDAIKKNFKPERVRLAKQP